MHALVASTDTPAAAAGGGTAALLHNTCLLAYAGFAMTAKPSVNLLVLLQVVMPCLLLPLPAFLPYRPPVHWASGYTAISPPVMLLPLLPLLFSHAAPRISVSSRSQDLCDRDGPLLLYYSNLRACLL